MFKYMSTLPVLTPATLSPPSLPLGASRNLLSPIKLLHISCVHQLPILNPLPQRVIVAALVLRVPHHGCPIRALPGCQAPEVVRIVLCPVEPASRRLSVGRVERRIDEGVVEPVVEGHVAAAHDGLAEVVEAVV